MTLLLTSKLISPAGCDNCLILFLTIYTSFLAFYFLLDKTSCLFSLACDFVLIIVFIIFLFAMGGMGPYRECFYLSRMELSRSVLRSQYVSKMDRGAGSYCISL